MMAKSRLNELATGVGQIELDAFLVTQVVPSTDLPESSQAGRTEATSSM